MKALDLTNQRFGNLVALQRAPKRQDKYTRWLCQCDCGETAEVRTDYLRNGHTTSCGCNKVPHFSRTTFEGQRYGRLIVLEQVDSIKYKCLCDCGNITVVRGYNLHSGTTKSCGCYQREQAAKANFQSLVGQKFGKLTVIERVENNRNNEVCYRCECECGGIAVVAAQRLRNGTTNSCGCIKSKGEMIINKWLKEHNFDYQAQYSIDEIILDSNRHPFFDFAIFKNGVLQCLIEYNGKQHYTYSGYGWDNEENFLKTQHRDNQKQEWCKKLNIPLYIIKHDEDIVERLGVILEKQSSILHINADMEEADGTEDCESC